MKIQGNVMIGIGLMTITFCKRGLVEDPIIEAIARLEFEDGLRTGVLPGGCWGP